MIRRSLAGLILGISLLAGSLAWSGYLSLRTVFDPDRSRVVAEELLDNEQVRAELTENLAKAIAGLVPDGVPVSQELIDSAATQALSEPAVEDLLLNAFANSHAAFLGDGDAPEELDLTPAAAAARDALVGVVPQLAGQVPVATELSIPLPTKRIPDASPVRSFLERVVPILAIASLIGVAVALFTTTDRPSILRRAGMWALGTTAFYLIVGLGVPWLLRRFAPDGAEVIAALLSAVLRSTFVPSIALGAIGAGLIGASTMWPAGGASRERTTRSTRPTRAPAPGQVLTPQIVPRRVPTPPPPRYNPAATQVQPAVHQPYPQGAPSQPSAPQPAPRPPQAPQPQTPPPPASAPPGNSVFEPGPAPTVRPEAVSPVPVTDMAPRYLDGHGWVLHPQDPRPRPANTRWIDGIGYVVPGPPPTQR